MDWRTAFLKQAQADFEILELLLRENAPLFQCLHYLQMTTEKLAKGLLTQPGGSSQPKTHDALVRFLRAARGDLLLRRTLGFDRVVPYIHYLNGFLPLADQIEGLSPEGEEHPNPEYPWEIKGVIYSPVEYDFGDLNFTNPKVREMMAFIKKCLTLTPD